MKPAPTNLFSFLVACVLLVAGMYTQGCTAAEPEDALETVLQSAGRNRTELEKVLDHYARSGDTLRYRAAEFLILHMDAQYSVSDKRTDEVLKALYQAKTMSEPQINQFMDSVVHAIPRAPKNVQRIPDLHTMKAEFLINNIDSAFAIRERVAWGDSIDFNTFCNAVLPYKSGNAPLQAWRTEYHNVSADQLDTLIDRGEMMPIVDRLFRIHRPKFRFVHNLGTKADFGAHDLLELKAGQCYQWAHTANNLLRAQSIPSVVIYAPRWATHPAGHAWNGVIQPDGKITPYAIEYAVPYLFNPMNWPLKSAKLYMLPYAKNPMSFAMVARSKGVRDIPEFLEHPCMVDVTAQMIPVTDVEISVQYPHPARQEFLFLCVFDRRIIDALAWSELKDGIATFKDLGRDVIYLPAFYYQSKYWPAGDAIQVSYDGDYTTLRAETSNRKKVRLYRKYPLKGSMSRYTVPFMGMKIQAGTDRQFSAPDDLHIISRYPGPVITDHSRQRDRWRWIEFQDSVLISPPFETTFLRFLAAPSKECVVGEIECYDVNGERLTGTPFGSKPGAEKIMDGLYGDSYHDPDTAGWVAIDFGRSVSVAKVRYLPSHDSNAIQAGDEYELFYWDREWISLGRQVATGKYLDYEIPANALLYLQNLDTGREERIFTLDANGEQLWW